MKADFLTHDEATALVADGLPVIYTAARGWHVANDNSADDAHDDATVRRAAYEAAMVEWHAAQDRAAKAGAAYYTGGHKVSIGGVPVRLSVKPCRHMLAVLRMDVHGKCKVLRDMAATRYPQTTYVEV